MTFSLTKVADSFYPKDKNPIKYWSGFKKKKFRVKRCSL